MKITVLLLNVDISSSLPVSWVVGRSGRKWATSRFDRTLNRLGMKGITHGHVAKMTLEQWNASALDIALESRHRGPRWIPCFVVEDAAEVPAPEPAQPAPEPVAEAVPLANPMDHFEEQSPSRIPADPEPQGDADGLDGVPFFTLRSIAKTEGVDIENLKGTKPIAQAIRLHRAQLAAV